MDLSEATKVLLHRIQKLEPEIAMKIMTCILIQDPGEREMIRLAYAPEKIIEDLVYNTKFQFSKPLISTSLSTPITINPPPVSEVAYMMPSSSNGSRPTFRVPRATYWDPQLSSKQPQSILNSDYATLGHGDSVADDYWLQNQANFVGFEGQMSNLRARASCHVPCLPEFHIKTCHYFNRGFCKHGSSCRYLHGSGNFFPFLGLNEVVADDHHMFSPASLETLDFEISELLKSTRGAPVSIASLPMMYYAKYRKTLQANGYLTESQRHGRAGFSLTKLLARLKTIVLIDRPHGQHSVILAEDASNYNLDGYRERNDPGPIVSGSRQIYMTFPAESTFSEEDVSNYFSTIGPVEDVRIPCQQKRMFGFVTFASAHTARIVLAKGSQHFVCGSRVLVKPYKEKPKLVERKYMENADHVIRCEPPRVLRRQLEEQEAMAIEMRRRLSELQLQRRHLHSQQFIDYGTEELHTSEEGFNYLLGFMNNSSTSDDISRHPDTDFADQDSQVINLPESPFTTAIGSGIPAVN